MIAAPLALLVAEVSSNAAALLTLLLLLLALTPFYQPGKCCRVADNNC